MSHSDQEAYGLLIQTGEGRTDRCWWDEAHPQGDSSTTRLLLSYLSFILRPTFSTASGSRAHPSIFTIRAEGSLFPCIWLLQRELDWALGVLCLTLWKWGLELTGVDRFSLDMAWSACMCVHVLLLSWTSRWVGGWLTGELVGWGKRMWGRPFSKGNPSSVTRLGHSGPPRTRLFTTGCVPLSWPTYPGRVRAPEPSRFSGWDSLMLFTFFGHLKYFLTILQQISITFVI